MTNEKGESFFVGKDVAKALVYSNSRDALSKHVDEEDKTTVAIRDTGSNYKTKAVIINESGLYSLILSSKLPTVLPVNETTPDRIVGTPSRKRHQQTIGVKNNVHYCLYGVRMCSDFHSSITLSLSTPSSHRRSIASSLCPHREQTEKSKTRLRGRHQGRTGENGTRHV